MNLHFGNLKSKLTFQLVILGELKAIANKTGGSSPQGAHEGARLEPPGDAYVSVQGLLESGIEFTLQRSR
jgi:hypothetical protein